jgi:hypothetical protein
MLTITTNSLPTAYWQTFRRLLSDGKKYDDPEIFRESSAVICIPQRSQSDAPVQFESGQLFDPFAYQTYFPHVTHDLIETELAYWNHEFFGKRKLDDLIGYLREFPLSKRAIILFWSDDYRNLSRGAACEVAAFFRIKNGRLDMHAHMRANNATFLLFMDMRILMGVQEFVAHSLGLDIGEYIHFIDSLHIYETDKNIAKTQHDRIPFSEDWRYLLTPHLCHEPSKLSYAVS